jgi:predicted NAD/FAD-binding protein
VTGFLSRRDFLQLAAATAVLPVAQAGAAPRRRSIGIVGGGMAGVSLAWLLDGAYDVTLLEARESIGGNVRTVDVVLDGHEFVVDMGAQYFHPGPYPVYTALLAQLGLFDPGAVEASAAHGFPASITLTAGVNATPRFVSPTLPDRWWALLAPWNWAGLWAFGVGFLAAKAREDWNASWDVTLDQWLPTLGLPREQWEGMLLPWAASLFSGDVEQCRGLSARAAMVFAAKALPPNPLDPLTYYVLKPGLVEALRRMVDQCSTLTVLTGAAVTDVTRAGSGYRLRCADGRTIVVDELVCAASGPATSRLLRALPAAALQRRVLDRMEFHDARLVLHTDPVYAPSDGNVRSFLNCDAHEGFCEASMWMASVISGPPPETAARLWKSWTTHRPQPQQVLHDTEFRHMLPTPATLRAQDGIKLLQGRDGIWFAGGYLYPNDSQETALRSALRVALGLGAGSARSRLLAAASNGAVVG